VNVGIIAEAAGLYAVANVDDLLVLSLFFGRGAGQPGAARQIVTGQYLGFASIMAVAVAVACGAEFLPKAALGYLGLLPLAVGLRAGWEGWREHRHGGEQDGDEQRGDEHHGEEQHGDKQGAPRALMVAAVTFANGTDDIGVYPPVFARSGFGEIAVYVTVFLVLAAVWCAVGWFLATRPAVARVIARWGNILYPLILVALGLSILVAGGAFGL
jgi:cadmium resistance protein CadD (predicted permease)